VTLPGRTLAEASKFAGMLPVVMAGLATVQSDKAIALAA
jgi:hypothetical protein